MSTTLNVVEIQVKRNPINDSWGVYRVYQSGNQLQEMLWTTAMIRMSAVNKAKVEAKKFGVGIKVAPKYA